MIIQAEEYILRTFKKDDVQAYFDLAHDELVKKYVPYAYPHDIEEAKENVIDYANGDGKNDFYLLIEKGNQLVGMIIAVRINKNILEVSAFITKNCRGKGIMTIAMNAFKKWLLDNTDYEKLVMAIDKANVASNTQIKKIGGEFKTIYENNYIYEVLIKS